MRILVVGGGGREHALVWKISQSRHAERLYCAPGNPGIARMAECINLKPTDLDGLAHFASDQQIDLTVVGPEAPLVAGIVDRFECRGLPIFGPSTDPARIEGSKSFAKELMSQYGIPTATFWRCDTPQEALDRAAEYFRTHPDGKPVVVKADGIAAGKGVVIAANEEEAREAVERIMADRVFGTAGERVVIEEYLEGEEASLMAFTDGDTVVLMPPVQDHKRIFEGDQGPNTGGMGAYSPVPAVPESVAQEALDRVLKPAVAAIRDLGIPYKGVLYAGLMLTPDGIRTVEFNCRFGDPEAQVVLPLLDGDLVEIIDAVVNSDLDSVQVRWKPEAAACVVAASEGYPGEYEPGKPIEGLDRAAAAEGCLVFQAGTRVHNGQVVTDGGRVLSVTGLGSSLPEAVSRAYAGLSNIRFDGMHYRRDIASRALPQPRSDQWYR